MYTRLLFNILTQIGQIVFDHDNIDSPKIIFIQIMKSERKKESEFTVRFVCVKKIYMYKLKAFLKLVKYISCKYGKMEKINTWMKGMLKL